MPQLGEEEFVPLEVIQTLGLRLPAHRAQYTQLGPVKREDDLPVLADDLRRATPRPLNEVLLHVHRQRATIVPALQQRAGDVLHVHLETGPVAREGEEPPRHPEEPAREI